MLDVETIRLISLSKMLTLILWFKGSRLLLSIICLSLFLVVLSPLVRGFPFREFLT